MKLSRGPFRYCFAGFLAIALAGLLGAGERPEASAVKVVDGVVQPRRAVAVAITAAMQFLKKNAWGTYHEDIGPAHAGYLSAEPMSFTADYLFRNAKEHPECIEMGREVIRRMEKKLVRFKGHAAAPAVGEQAGYNHLMPGHTARYCLALARLYAVTGDEEAKRRALSGINATTYMQSERGLFRTFFSEVKGTAGDGVDWYSQHLFTVCHLLEAMSCFSRTAADPPSGRAPGPVLLRPVPYCRVPPKVL